MTRIMSLSEWQAEAKHATSGDMVFDILASWEESQKWHNAKDDPPIEGIRVSTIDFDDFICTASRIGKLWFDDSEKIVHPISWQPLPGLPKEKK